MYAGIGCGFILSELATSYAVDAVVATLVFTLLVSKSSVRSSVQLMFAMGFGVFIYAPAMLNGYIFDTPFTLFYLTTIPALSFLLFTNDLVYKRPLSYRKGYLVLFLAFALVVIVGSVFKINQLFFLSVLVMFYALSLRTDRSMFNLTISFIFLITFLVYYLFGWDGFGRTVTFGMLITAFLYFCYATGIFVPKFVVIGVAMAGSIIAVGRKGYNTALDLDVISQDSVVGPYRLASEFLDHAQQSGLDLRGFVDQVIFSLFSFVPRGLWPSKPFGFGYQYVLDNMDPYLALAGHSIASTLIGDHLYYLGLWGVITGIVMCYVIAKFCRLANSMKLFDGFGVVLFSSNMMVLIWGGMTSFSARIIHPLIIFSFLIWIYFLLRRLRIGAWS